LESIIIHRKPQNNHKVKKILVIRLQAIGDVLITLPYLQDLRNKLPNDVRFDMLVRKETENVPRHLCIFNNVYSIAGGRNTKKQFFYFLCLLPKLLFNRYDVLIDLQNNRLTKYMQFFLRIKSYTLFDKSSPIYAGDRNKNTINALGLATVEFSVLNSLKPLNDEALLKKYNVSKELKYVVINPAGAFENRNWDLDNYVNLCRLWNKHINEDTEFIVLGIDKIKEKSNYLKNKLGSKIINLVGTTDLISALHILQKAQLVISEDSGLLHASYIMGVPTIGLIGSTRSDWLNPSLPHTYFFTSSDLPCGDCMLEHCKFDEVKCLTRLKPEDVIKQSVKLLNMNEKTA